MVAGNYNLSTPAKLDTPKRRQSVRNMGLFDGLI